MSAAAAAAVADPDVPVAASTKGGKKKLLLIGIVVLLVLLLAGGGAAFWLKKKAAHAAAEAADDDVALSSANAVAKPDPAHPPTFLPLEPFVVNLADKDVERYAQVGVTLEVDSAVFADEMKAYMPAVRNAILMILAHKSSRELLERAGKEQLADEIMRETVRPMGISIPAPPAPKAADDAKTETAAASAPKAKAAEANRGPHNPVRHVHFSNFIIQ